MSTRGGANRDADRIICILDRAAHQSTSDLDVVQSINGIRRIVDTLRQTPSEVLRASDDKEDEDFQPEDFVRLRQDYDKAVNERTGLVAENKRCHATLRQKEALLIKQSKLLLEKDAVVAKLHVQIEAMRIEHQARIDAATAVPAAPPLGKDSYSYSEVMSIIWMRFGKMNGALKSLAAYNAMLREKDPNIPVITGTTVQVWRRQNRYPAWAVDQLRSLTSITKVRLKWTPEHVAFLRDTYKLDPTQTDEELAHKCSERFKFEINDNSIKSKLNVLRAKKEIPLRSQTS